MSFPYFNSIKVQLELILFWWSGIMHTHFNSIKVQLEQTWIHTFLYSLLNFNSIKVQLELSIKSAHRSAMAISIP